MTYLQSYKRLNVLLQNESYEPMFMWGVRMALAGTIPVLVGIATGHISASIWVALSAEAVSWMELKGSFTWRFRSLIAGALLALLAAIPGSVTGNSLWLSCAGMLVVGFVATLLKNIGDRASGLAICFYLLFIFCNAYPVTSSGELWHRLELLSLGTTWALVLGTGAATFMPEQEPFRRYIAIIWRAVARLTDAVSRIDNRDGYTSTLANVYKHERDLRAAINGSYEFFGQMAHQASTRDNRKYQLTQLRKTASLVAVNVIAMGEEMEHISIAELDLSLRAKAARLFGALQEAADRMAAFTMTIRAEEMLLVRAQITRLQRLTLLIREYPLTDSTRETAAILRILQLTDRTVKLLLNALEHMDKMGGDQRVFHSYSLIKTLFVLRPKYLLRNVRALFLFNSFTFKYALRSAIAATVALWLYKWLPIDHGYWLPFSVMIVIQPYFGATLRKAMDRIGGTLAGIVAGSLLLYLPFLYTVQPVILFFTFLLMVYYLKRNYAIAAFFITLNLVLLFNIEASFDAHLMVARVGCTVGGAILAILAGWLVLPTPDRKLLPRHLADAIAANYSYFRHTFYAPVSQQVWTRLKRNAETRNSNVFDSFNRYMSEPGRTKSATWYDLITCNVRITRSLNNVHTESEEQSPEDQRETIDATERIDECMSLYRELAVRCRLLYPRCNLDLPSEYLQPTRQLLSHSQAIAIEKITVDLRGIIAGLDKLPIPGAG